MTQVDFGNIMVAFDGSEDSVKAIRAACSLARKYGSKVAIAHAYSFPISTLGGASPMAIPDVQPLEDAAKARASSALDHGLRIAKEEGVSAVGELIEAPSIVQALLDYATEQKIDLIVTGTRGMTGFKKLIMGSVSSGLVSHAECPVLVVR